MVQIINIDPVYERLLPFLYPSYSIETALQKFNKFILKKDITNPVDMRILRDNYEDCVVISTKLYDEFWDEEKIREKALEFRRVNFKTRKRTLADLSSDDQVSFIDNILSFMFTGEYDFVEDEGIMELFNSYGSLKFSDLFMQKCEIYPPSKVIASMMTFLSKVNDSATTAFYMKKNSVLGSKIKENFTEALEYLKTYPDINNLHFLTFFQMLVR